MEVLLFSKFCSAGSSALLEGLAGNDDKWLEWPAYMAEGLPQATWLRQNTEFSLAVGLSG